MFANTVVRASWSLNALQSISPRQSPGLKYAFLASNISPWLYGYIWVTRWCVSSIRRWWPIILTHLPSWTNFFDHIPRIFMSFPIRRKPSSKLHLFFLTSLYSEVINILYYALIAHALPPYPWALVLLCGYASLIFTSAQGTKVEGWTGHFVYPIVRSNRGKNETRIED